MSDKGDAAGLVRQVGGPVADLGWQLLLLLMVIAVVALPALVVWAFVDSDAWMTVLVATIGIGVTAAVISLGLGGD